MPSVTKLYPMGRSFESDDDSRIHYLGMETMTPAEWHAIPDNPRQRDTIGRAKRAAHLRVLHPSHRKVTMARCDDVGDVKVDAHSRDFLWHLGTPPGPEMLFVDVWRCKSIEDAKDLYDTFDSPDAVETTRDKIFGAERELNVEFQSDLLRNKRYTNALRTAHEMIYGLNERKSIKIHKLVAEWLPELRLLDEVMPRRDRFIGGVCTGALITFGRYKEEAVPFWSAYSRDAGFKEDGERDAVQALWERVMQVRATGSAAGGENMKTMAEIALRAYDGHREQRLYSRGLQRARLGDVSYLRRWLDKTASARRRSE